MRRRRRGRWVAALVLTVLASAVDARGAEPMGSVFGEPWARLLAAHTRAVSDTAGTRVDYAALARDSAWRAFVAALASEAPPAADAPRAEQLAFWINAYNALAIDVVVKNLPLASIRDAGTLLRPVWKREAGRIGGRAVTLDEIEHEILRPMGEPRIHMAIVCASTSCPSLAREPFEAASLEAQLDAAAARFVADERKGARVETGALRLSPIFRWFAQDFRAAGGVLAFVRRFASPALREALARLGDEPRIVYFDYDWSLNGAAPSDDDAREKSARSGASAS